MELEATEDEKLARRIAHIMGKSSAAAAALDELERRRANGELAWIESRGKVWVVGSAPSANGDGENTNEG